MLTRSVLRSASRLHIGIKQCSMRSMSTGILNINKDDKSGVAIVEMNRPPVNSLSLDMLTEMYLGMEKLENDKSCKGVVLSTTNPSIFSAGLDIMEMYNPKEERLREFWKTLQNVFIKFYGSRLATVAAISGHSPAGGCLLSLSCDYRVMAEGKFAIGLNETLLGIVAPFWFQDAMVNTIGQRETEKALQLGKMYSSQEALDVGLVDQLVPKDKVMEAAMGEMAKWMKIPEHARVLTKDNLRRPLIQRLLSQQQEDIDNFVTFITRDPIQKGLHMYLESLKKKK